MWKRWRFAVLVGFAVLLAACGGKGVDKKIATDSEAAYRKTLDEAWADMTVEQQNAYNWAVSNYTLEGLIGAYPEITPRKVINAEADAYIAHHTSQITSITAELAANAERLAADERTLREVSDELAKITFEPIGLREDKFFGRQHFEYVVHNGSQYDISSLRFNAWVFVDDEESSDRRCSLFGYYKSSNGLPQGKSLKDTMWLGFDCRTWETLEVKNAKKLTFRIDLDPASVKNFAEKTILPTLSTPTRSEYERRLKAAEEEIAAAMQAKASLLSVKEPN